MDPYERFPAMPGADVGLEPEERHMSPAWLEAKYSTRQKYSTRHMSAEIQYARFACGVVEMAIAARVLLAALGANPRAGFICLLDALTWVLVMPFAGVFAAPTDGLHTLDLSSLVAMSFYGVVTWGVIAWLRRPMRTPRPAPQREPSAQRHDGT